MSKVFRKICVFKLKMPFSISTFLSKQLFCKSSPASAIAMSTTTNTTTTVTSTQTQPPQPPPPPPAKPLKLSKCTDGVFLSGLEPAKKAETLKEYGITHVVRIIHSKYFYTALDGITYHSVDALDSVSQDLRTFFNAALEFMRTAIEAQGKVLVHCQAGISRSATIVIAYIMKYEGKTFSDSLRQVRSARPVVNPNHGFVVQLRKFEKDLELAATVEQLEKLPEANGEGAEKPTIDEGMPPDEMPSAQLELSLPDLDGEE